MTICSPDHRGWIHRRSHSRLKRKYNKNIPPKFVIGPDTISILMMMDGPINIVKPGDVCVYLGKKAFKDRAGSIKTLRLILVNGEVGFIEGKHVKYLEPI